MGPSALWGSMVVVVLPLPCEFAASCPCSPSEWRVGLCGLLFEVEVIQIGHVNGCSDPSLFSLSCAL